MKIRFLLDENLAPLLKSALLRLDPTIDVVRVGDADAPPFHTLDPDILAFCEAEQRLLVTGNRKSARSLGLRRSSLGIMLDTARLACG